MNYRKVLEEKPVTVQQVSKFAQEFDVYSRCPGCLQMVLERNIKHPCLDWPFRSLA
jgi:hypothetical protein